jgi:hypothetical protein
MASATTRKRRLESHSYWSTIGVLSECVGRPPAAVRETKVTVKIPRPLYRKIQHVVDGSGFNSPTDFIVYVLRDLMGEAEGHGASESNKDEIEELKRKLKKLGYL